MSKPGQDPATLRALADELHEERLGLDDLAAKRLAEASAEPHPQRKMALQEWAADIRGRAYGLKTFAAKLRSRATRSEQS